MDHVLHGIDQATLAIIPMKTYLTLLISSPVSMFCDRSIFMPRGEQDCRRVKVDHIAPIARCIGDRYDEGLFIKRQAVVLLSWSSCLLNLGGSTV